MYPRAGHQPLGHATTNKEEKDVFYPPVTARNIALHSLMPYIESSLKKVTRSFQIRLFPYKRVKFTKFSPKKVCQVRKKEFPCFMLITVIFPAKRRPYNVTSGKNCFYTFSFTKLYSGDWASIRLDRWSKAFVKNDFDLIKKILDAHPSCW